MADNKKRRQPFRKLSLDSFKSVDSLDKSLSKFYCNVDDEGCFINKNPHHTQDLSTKGVDTAFHLEGSSSKVSVGTTSGTSEAELPQVLQRVAGHARSQSDGCQNIHLNSAHRLSTHAKHSHNLSLNCENLQSSVTQNVDKFSNMSHSCNSVIRSDYCNSSTSWIESSPLFFEGNNSSDEKEENERSQYESRFPKPRPGESLMSFLSSADLYQNCGALERENAHFYISEALMAAFEQMRFETECRAAGLLSDSGDDSDEEIKCLQKEIRRRKLEKLDRLQTRELRNETSVPRASNVLLQSASTTDYSVYESPLSSTHTESSDPELLTSREQGVRMKSTSSAAVSRPRKKALKRVRTRPLGRPDWDGLWSSSGYSGPCDTSAYESNNEVCPPMSSTCVMSKANASDVVQEDTDDTSLASNDGSSDNKTLLGLEDATERANPALINEDSTNGQTEMDSLPASRVVAEEENSYVTESSDLVTVKSEGYGFHGRNSSLDVPLHLPDHHTAEGIGLRLLQHLGSPQRQLPKASDLQWLVSERDAPQELLPLPTGGVSGKDQVLLRGTSDWAPPREQLILLLVKAKKRRRALEDQKYRCAGCGQHVLPGLSKHYRLCHYFMRYFCATCHMNQTHVIPAKLLHLWDGKAYPVSCLAHQLLTRLAAEPLFYPSAINPSLYSPNNPLSQFRLHRLQLINCLPYIYSCSRAASESRLTRSLCPTHWLSDCEVVTLHELLSIKLGTSLDGASKGLQSAGGGSVRHTLQYITTLCLDHVSHCQACQGRGFICEVCQDDTPIFPFELATVRVCPECSACTHYRCTLTRCSRCKIRKEKRLRLTQRQHTRSPDCAVDLLPLRDASVDCAADTKKLGSDIGVRHGGESRDVNSLQGVQACGAENSDLEKMGKRGGNEKERVLSQTEAFPTSAEIGEEGDNGSEFALTFGTRRNEDTSEVDESSRKSSILNTSSKSSSIDSSSVNLFGGNESSQNAVLEENYSDVHASPMENLILQRSSDTDSNSSQSLACVEKTATAAASSAVDYVEAGELSAKRREICNAEATSIPKLRQRQPSVDSKAVDAFEVLSHATNADANDPATPRDITKGVGTLRPFMSLRNSLYGSRRSRKQNPDAAILYESGSSQ